MKKIVLTFGVISGLVMCVLAFATLPFVEQIGFDRSVLVGYTTMVIAFMLVFFGIRSYRENVGGGEISFGRAFKVGILITLISSVFYVIAWEIIYFNFLPDFADKYTNYLVEKARASGASAEEIAQRVESFKQMKAFLDNPWLSAPVIFISEPLPVGLVMTLISSLLLRKRRKDRVGEMQSAVG